jgi:hypothetical protein
MLSSYHPYHPLATARILQHAGKLASFTFKFFTKVFFGLWAIGFFALLSETH